MKRSDLEHVIRAAADISGSTDIVIIGSQAILGAYPNPPAECVRSVEADGFPLSAPEKSLEIDSIIGELSDFHSTHGYYFHGVGPETAKLPIGWESRLVTLANSNTLPGRGFCIEIHDLAAAKLAAYREKDLEYVKVLLDRRYIFRTTLIERVMTLPVDKPRQTLILEWIEAATKVAEP